MEEKIAIQRGWHCTVIENHIIHSDISCHAKIVYVVLCMYANVNDKTCYPSLKTICNDSSIKSKTTVKKGIDELIEKGYLEVVNRKGDKGTNESNLYIIKDYPISGNGIGQEMIQGRSGNDIGVGQEMVHPISGDGHELKPINKNQKNNIYTQDFLNWYGSYPNKFNKEQSFKNWKTLLKKETKENIIAATEEYKKQIKKNNTDLKYITRSTNFIGQKAEYKGYLKQVEAEPKKESRKVQVIVRECI